MSANMNLKSVTMKEFLNLVRESILDEDFTTPILCLGKSGIGKTEGIAGLCKELGIGCKELRLVTLTEVDLLGVPTIEELPGGRKTTTWASLDNLPFAERDGEKGILVLDEITSCSRTVRAAAYQLLDSKRALGNYKLPEKWLVVALGNGPEDGGVFEGIEYAFLGRCLAVRVEPDLNSWKSWAVDNNVHPTVVGFISWQPDYLHQINPNAEFEEKLPCPRTWTKLSIKLTNAEKRKGGMLDDRSVEIYAAAAVGEKAANDFAAFYQYKKHTISVDEILEGKGIDKIKKLTPEVQYLQTQTLVSGIVNELKQNYDKTTLDWPDKTYHRIANACKWMVAMADVSLDAAIFMFNEVSSASFLFVQLITGESGKFDDLCPEFIEFLDKYSLTFKTRS